jgi:hypothetical protein
VAGVVAPNPALDHTGALVWVGVESGIINPLCSATLIGRETAVTAKHCAQSLGAFEQFGTPVMWARGANAREPDELVRIVAAESPEPGDEPGALGLGYDIALIHFADPVEAEPAIVKAFSPDLLGASMVSLGYGMSAARVEPDGLRRIGRESVVALDGLLYQILYGDFESFVEAEVEGRVSDTDYVALAQEDPSIADLASLREQFDGTRLIPEHEICANSLRNTRGCRGDSGGPLLRVGARGEWEVHGVLSGGPRSARAECDFGEVYATFGPHTFSFVEQGRSWTDPCGDVDEVGLCDGALMRRCESHLATHVRRLIEQDCGAAGQPCVAAEGSVQCGAPSG